MPCGSGDRLSPREIEHDRVNANRRIKAELGATRVPDTELPNANTLLQMEDVVSLVAAPITCCKLA